MASSKRNSGSSTGNFSEPSEVGHYQEPFVQSQNSHVRRRPASSINGGDEEGLDALRIQVLRLASFQRGYTFKQQKITRRQSRTENGTAVQAHTSTVTQRVKFSYAFPQFSVLALYMLLSIHATLLYEYLGAPLAYIAFFTASARSIDVFTDPVMSYISDSTRSRFGRRIPYMVGGCLVYALAVNLLLGAGVIFPPDSTAECIANGTNPDTDLPNFELIGGPEDTSNEFIAYWYGATFVFFYLTDTLCNVPYNALAPELSDSSDERQNIYFVQNIFGMVGTMIGALAPPLLEVAGLSKELSFLITGLFFGGYYVIMIINLAYNLGERTEGYEDNQSVPLVPSTVRSFSNPGFRVLLLSWFIDSVGWYSLASVLPLYVKYFLEPGKAGVWWLTDEIFLGIALSTLFISAILGMPMWKFFAKKFGRYPAWLAYNLWNGISNALYIMVQPGDWEIALIITILNGIPFGGKFLSDSNLSDCIDYDEFRTGDRREAQYTMFASFVPKIVSIPAQAMPLAIISAFDFAPSKLACTEDGDAEVLVQEQNFDVRKVIQLIFAFFPVFTNLISFAVKTGYPFVKRSQIEMVSAGIALHASGFPAEDPVTGEVVRAPQGFSDIDKALGIKLDYFYAAEKRKILLARGDVSVLLAPITTTFFVSILMAGSCMFGVVKTFHLLDDTTKSFVPSLLQILFGMALMVSVFTFIRLRHAIKMSRSKPFTYGFVKRWVQKHEGLNESMNPLWSNPGFVLEKLQETYNSDDDEDPAEILSERKESKSALEKRELFQRKVKRASGVKRKVHNTYAGSTRNFVIPDESAKQRLMAEILGESST